MQSNIAYSMGKARRNSLTNREQAKMPGPGVYKQGNINVIRNQNPQWSIKGKGQGEKYSKDGPGPGQYDDGFKKHGSPNYSFGNKLSKTFYVDGSRQPGPGQYKQPDYLGKLGGYIGGRYQQKQKGDVPGPGQYSMRSTFNAKGNAFGAGKRSSPNLNRSVQMPGPGQYAPTSMFGNRTHGAGFGTGKRNEMTGNKMPGPGTYQVNDSLYRDPKAASIKGRPKTSKIDSRPGPGHYQSKSVHTSPAFSMGAKTKIKESGAKDNPGPGNYNGDYTKIKYSTPGINFGSPSKSVMHGDSSMPGPGQYDLGTRVGTEGPSHTIKGRYPDPKGDLKPGPGNYDPRDEITRHGTPNTAFGKGQRSNLGKGDGAPGPGNYDLNKHLNKGVEFTFGSGLKGDNSLEKRSKDMPGPGTYAPQSFMGKDSQGKTIAGKIAERPRDNVPGPGQYGSPDKSHGPSYSISGHRTEDPIMREKAKMPPPGTYNADDTSTKYKSPSVSFGSKPKASNLMGDGMPGPGQYQLKSTLEGRGVHIAGKNPEKITERAPGPGQYEPKDNPKHKSGPSFTIGGVTGDQSNPNKNFPGPGTYGAPDRPSTTGGNFRFGTEERKGLGTKNDMPGPGQYTLPSRVGNEGKSIIMTGRHEDKVNSNQVGPGQYQMPSTISGPKYSMGAGEKGTKLNKDSLNNPAPGTYTVDANAGKSSAPGVLFGKGERDKLKPDNLPGPGNYALPSTLENRGITIQGRHDEKIKDKAPGPGTYDDKPNPMKTHGGGIKFGHDTKSTVIKDSGAPGPGQYLIKLPYDKGPKIGKDLRDRPQKSEMPGPAHYNTRKEEGLTYF